MLCEIYRFSVVSISLLGGTFCMVVMAAVIKNRLVIEHKKKMILFWLFLILGLALGLLYCIVFMKDNINSF